jgi:hypothetical protein
MEWHVDDALYNPEQIEIVFTIENNSDCVTKWDLHDNTDKINSSSKSNSNRNNHKIKKGSQKVTKRVEVETEPNSAILIKAGPNGAPHFVSALKTGRRSILKFVFIEEGATLLDDAKDHVNQFTTSKKQQGKRKRKQKKKN